MQGPEPDIPKFKSRTGNGAQNLGIFNQTSELQAGHQEAKDWHYYSTQPHAEACSSRPVEVGVGRG